VSENRFRELLQTDRYTKGYMSFIDSEVLVDLAGYAGFDWLMFDQEHASYDINAIERMVRAAEARGMPTIARIPNPDPYLIQRVLDTGIDGLMFARVNTSEEAAELVSLCRLAPDGKRGACPGSRSAHYFFLDKPLYQRRANDTVVVLMIETKEGFDNFEEILAVPGIDGIAVGQSDLSFSLGVERNDPIVIEAERKLTELARDAGIAVISNVKKPQDIQRWLDMPNGPRMFWYTTDAYLIAIGFKQLIEENDEIVARHAEEAQSSLTA
jgi:4-hydroxy-2-oxoheptanedioate aldolase